MSRVHILIAALIACLPGAAQEPGFHPLFDGKTLQGWSGDSRLWKVEDGLLAGTTEGVPPIEKNTFLIHKTREFGDFILRFDVKLRNGNSGVQFRSEELPDFVVKGLQADMAENNWWGSIYDERGTRGVMVNGWKGKAETVVKPNDWNEVELSDKGRPHPDPRERPAHRRPPRQRNSRAFSHCNFIAAAHAGVVP